MIRCFCFLLFCYSLTDTVNCDKADDLIITSMKNDMTKSVKKVLDGSSYQNVSEPSPHPNATDVSSQAPLNRGVHNITSVTNATKSKSVPFEGGGFINVTSVNRTSGGPVTPKPSVTPLHLDKADLTSTTTVAPVSVQVVVSPSVSLDNRTTVRPQSVSNVVVSSTSSPAIKIVTEERKISARKGVDTESPSVKTTSPSKPEVSSTTSAYASDPTTRRHKPMFAMVLGDHESKERKSFIESPTTGKDYIFPIVLTIMALPLLFVVVKLIYKRGSEYTERRHYDRMYLIDGMYNAR